LALPHTIDGTAPLGVHTAAARPLTQSALRTTPTSARHTADARGCKDVTWLHSGGYQGVNRTRESPNVAGIIVTSPEGPLLGVVRPKERSIRRRIGSDVRAVLTTWSSP
jgi:hypothetical protein